MLHIYHCSQNRHVELLLYIVTKFTFTELIAISFICDDENRLPQVLPSLNICNHLPCILDAALDVLQVFDRPGRHFRRHLRVERLAVLGFEVIDDEALYRQRLEEYMRVVLSHHAGLSQYDGMLIYLESSPLAAHVVGCSPQSIRRSAEQRVGTTIFTKREHSQ